jgi:hypothetical protein
MDHVAKETERHFPGRESYEREAPRPIPRQPEPPARLDQLERHAMASEVPAAVLVDRALIRGLMRYVRRLERDVGGSW